VFITTENFTKPDQMRNPKDFLLNYLLKHKAV